MREVRSLESILNAGAIQVVERPRVIGVEWEPCVDELGAAALVVRLELGEEPGAGAPRAEAGDERLLRGARSIWEALVLSLYESGEERFPYVTFRSRCAPAEDGARA